MTGSPQPSDSARARPNTSANRPDEAMTVPGMSSRGESVPTRPGTWCSSRRPATAAGTANRIDTYRHERQSSTSVTKPPSSKPNAPPAPAMAP